MSEKLREEVAGLEAAARAYTARHQRIENLTWPDGARIAVNFTADFDAMLLRRLNNEPPMQLAKGEFGGRVGIWRLIELFDSHTHQGHRLHGRAHLRALSAGAQGGRREAGTSLPTTCGSTACPRSPSSSATICSRPATPSRGSAVVAPSARAAITPRPC